MHLVARLALALVFVYQGLVPKMLLQHSDELAMMEAGGIPPSAAPAALMILGAVESAFGLLLLIFWHWRWPVILVVPGMVAVTLGVAATSPGFLVSAFNAVALNAAVLALAAVAWLSSYQRLSSRNCCWSAWRGDPA